MNCRHVRRLSFYSACSFPQAHRQLFALTSSPVLPPTPLRALSRRPARADWKFGVRLTAAGTSIAERRSFRAAFPLHRKDAPTEEGLVALPPTTAPVLLPDRRILRVCRPSARVRPFPTRS